ncbi:MAG: dockerin type I domain-containing protein, partial [Clostridia bacterium]|nr:dockerin type I domain-containing protein [Clostridia bacterium]
IYNLFSTGTGKISSGNDTWSTYTYTLPNDGNSYYLYFAGECSASAWAGKNILIDNFTVTNAATEIAYDSFDTILNAGLFTADPTVVSLLDYDYDYLSITISNMSENAANSFITKEAYPAQSTITFDAFVPNCGTSDQWWGVRSTTDPDNASIYDCWTNPATCVAHAGEWYNYSFNIGGDVGQQRYIYLGGNIGSNWQIDGVPQALLIKNVKITAQNGTVLATEDFSGGLSRNIFKCQSSRNGKTVVSVAGEGVARENVYAAIQIDKIASAPNAPADFITKDAFSGGSTVSFDACTPAGVTWWAVSYTDDPSDVGLYKWTSGEGGRGQSYVATNGIWKHYSYTLPDDANSYYVYFVGAKGEWQDQSLLIDNVVITSKNGESLAFEDFSGGVCNSIFKAMNTSVTDSRLMVEKDNTHSASIIVDNMRAQSFITKKAYPGGSTVTFEALLPKTNGKEDKWWGACFTTDPANSSVYNVFTPGKGKQLGIAEEKWTSYSFTLPDDGNDYYFHFGANIGNWTLNDESMPLLVDNFTVLDAQNYLLDKEDFENGLEKSIFNCQTVDSQGREVVSLYEEVGVVPAADINRDGAINVIDLIVMKKYLANMITLSAKEKTAADLNGNSFIDSTDMILLKQFILAGITPEDEKNALIGANGNWWIGEYDTGISASSTSGDIVSLSVQGAAPSFEYATPAKDVELKVTANYSDGSKKFLSKAEYEIADISSLTYKTEGNYTGEVFLREDPAKKATFSYSVTPKKSLKVLFIGNSFSECTVYLLHDVAASLGIELQVEDMHIAGCPIDEQ